MNFSRHDLLIAKMLDAQVQELFVNFLCQHPMAMFLSNAQIAQQNFGYVHITSSLNLNTEDYKLQMENHVTNNHHKFKAIAAAAAAVAEADVWEILH